MSKRIFARLATNVLVSDGHGGSHRAGLVGARVSLMNGSYKIGPADPRKGITGSDGSFSFDYSHRGPGHAVEVEVVARDSVGRVLPFATSTGRMFVPDVDGDQLDGLPDLLIRELDATGFGVTLGTGEVRALSSNNQVRMLVDQDVFTRAAELIAGAQKTITISQLFFAVPPDFRADPAAETPKLVFDFHQTPPDLDHPRTLLPTDARPERLLADAARRGVDVRILLHAYTVPLYAKPVVYAVAGRMRDAAFTDTDEVSHYFSAAAPTVRVRGFKQPLPSAGVMHAKLMDVDGRFSMSFGGPFGQSYVDRSDHRIDAWIRGGSSGLPQHDVGFETSGPVIADLFAALKLLWDTDTNVPGDQLPHPGAVQPPPSTPPPPTPVQPDAECSIQVVRTLTAGRFGGALEAGEMGVLEAYLRGFNAAENLIYLENQYFTNEAIGAALVEAIRNKPGVQVIVLVNIAPDQTWYPRTQRRLITRIRDEIAKVPGGRQRFGVFTRWTHETGPALPRILPIYVHAKVGIVDNIWAMVGSANLDGLSLDEYGLWEGIRCVLHYIPLPGLDLIPVPHDRAVEINAVMTNEFHSDDPDTAAGVLRRRLWAEHLGFSKPDGTPDPDAPELLAPPPGGWLDLWRSRAEQTLRRLVDHPAQPQTGLARVLPWPTDDTTHKTPRDHLAALGVHTQAIVPLKSTRKFDFRTGNWVRGSTAKMDF